MIGSDKLIEDRCMEDVYIYDEAAEEGAWMK